MLKPESGVIEYQIPNPAAFRRLCVETPNPRRRTISRMAQPPSGGCVLKPHSDVAGLRVVRPAAFRRLCVETVEELGVPYHEAASRLQAAVC